MRTTKKTLYGLLDQLNVALDAPRTAYMERDGRYQANPGHYHFDIAYGGYQLSCMVGEGGSITTISPRLPAGQMADYLRAILMGIYTERQRKDKTDA